MIPGRETGFFRRYSILFLVISILLVSSLACSVVSSFAGDDAGDAMTEEALQEDEEDDVDVPEAEEDSEEAAVEEENAESEGSDAGETAAPPAGTGGCINVLYPMVQDQQWIYQVTSAGEVSKLGMTVSEVSDDLATVDMLAYETGVTTAADVVCEDGAIINFPSMMLGFLFGDVDGEIELEHIDGVYAPAFQVLEDNDWDYDWETDYVASGVLTAVADGESFSATLSDSPVHMEWETAGARETVEVEAGTFEDAVVVERKAEFDAALTLESDGETLSIEGTVILETKLWFMPFEGLVKQEVTRTQLKLGLATFPVESDTEVELVEFYPVE